mgnify:CR=1 FL=1
MKINKKLIIFIPILVAVLVFIGVYLYYYSEDINSLTVTDKNWIEENIQSLVDIEVVSDYPIYGEKNGVFDDFKWYDQRTLKGLNWIWSAETNRKSI